jgi:hypothetical protein
MRRMGILTEHILEEQYSVDRNQIQTYLADFDYYDLDTTELRIYSIKYLQDNNIQYEVLRGGGVKMSIVSEYDKYKKLIDPKPSDVNLLLNDGWKLHTINITTHNSMWYHFIR